MKRSCVCYFTLGKYVIELRHLMKIVLPVTSNKAFFIQVTVVRRRLYTVMHCYVHNRLFNGSLISSLEPSARNQPTT